MPEPGPAEKFKVYVWPDLFVYVMSAQAVQRHHHHGLQITIGLEDSFRMETTEGDWQEARLMLTAPDVPHTLKGPNDYQVVCQIMPETEAGRAFQATYFNDRAHHALAIDLLAPLLLRLQKLRRSKTEPDEVRTLVQEVTQELLGGEFRLGYDQALDPRVQDALRMIHRMPEKTASLDDVAASVDLSPSRFRHLFKAETGVTFRNYLMQRRLTAAIKRWLAERDLTVTELAYETGFADGAHLSRVFKRITGFPPSAIKAQLPYWDAWVVE